MVLVPAIQLFMLIAIYGTVTINLILTSVTVQEVLGHCHVLKHGPPLTTAIPFFNLIILAALDIVAF